MIVRCLLHPSSSVFWTHTSSLAFDHKRKSGASSATPKRGSSHWFAAQKKDHLWCLWPGALRMVRPQHAASSRPVLCGYARLSGGRGTSRPLSKLRQGEAGAARLPGRQPAVHQAVCLLRRTALPQRHRAGRGPRTAPGLARRQGVGQAIHGGSTGPGRHRDPVRSASTKSRFAKGTPTVSW